MNPPLHQQPDPEDVLVLWDNLPPVIKGISIAGIVTYFATLLVAVGFREYISWYASIGLIAWPLILVLWLLVIWVAIAVFSTANVLVGGKGLGSESKNMLLKTVVFIPAVIGTALTVVEVFVNDVFSRGGEEEIDT